LVLDQGTLEILEAGASSVTFKLAGTDQESDGEPGQVIPSDGKYTALRCH
jgi:hypothetical protein